MQKYIKWMGILLLFASYAASAADYPDMLGVWVGEVRVVESGTIEEGRVAQGGAVISLVELTLTIEHQDAETFIGKTRTSRMDRSDPSTHVWGTIRSNGQEALFVTSTGGRGQLWFEASNKFEFCITNRLELESQEFQMSAYCARLTKK